LELLAGTTTTTDASAADTARLKVLLFQILLGKIMVTSYYLAIFALSAALSARAITIGRVEVPKYPVVGGTANLVCNYKLEKGKNGGQEERLYSVKWYKDFKEFYRFNYA